MVARDKGEASEKLRLWRNERTPKALAAGQVTAARKPKVAFVFTGQGAQYAGMGRQLYDAEPRFRAAIDRCAALMDDALGARLTDVLFGPQSATFLADTRYVQPALFACEYALADLLRRQGMPFALFEGGMSGPEKDAAVDAFRERVPLLLCSESGGEGRNLQFCNTLINFDIPWNPMAIEQRIGRIDRIGQTREVYVFKLVTAGTVEDQMLRILDEKINMFELVVGEVGAILGELEEHQEFSSLVLEAWLESTDQARAAAFGQLEDRLVAARRQYEGVKALDEALFGNELDAA